jgi:hypothetical protein
VTIPTEDSEGSEEQNCFETSEPLLLGDLLFRIFLIVEFQLLSISEFALPRVQQSLPAGGLPQSGGFQPFGASNPIFCCDCVYIGVYERVCQRRYESAQPRTRV